jgi:hypothetical protein
MKYGLSVMSSDYYCPDRPIEKLIGDVKLPALAEVSIGNKLEGLCSLHRLPNGVIVIHAKMDIDADGSPNALTIDPEFGQLTTAFTYRGFSGQAAHVDAERVPYIVLPQHGPESADFYENANVRVGDIAAVIYKGRVQFAFVADIGPPDKIGEGSVALAQALGHDPFVVHKGQKLVDNAIPGGVIYIVFPGSRIRGLTPDNVVEAVNAEGQRLLNELTAERADKDGQVSSSVDGTP